MHCIFCGTITSKSEYDDDLIINSYSSSRFTRNRCLEESLTLRVHCCAKCGLSSFVTTSKHELLGSLNSKIRYNEPTIHLQHASLELVKRLDERFRTVLSIGGKNHNLTNILLEEMGNMRVIETERLEQISGIGPNTRKLFLCTRLIEHINSSFYLKSLLSCVDPGDLIYIEMLDMAKLFNRSNYSFIWNERVTYPSRDYLIRYMCMSGFRLRKIVSVEGAEPFFFLIMERLRKFSINQNSIATLRSASRIPLRDICSQLSVKISKIVAMCRQVNIFGIGHKSLTIIDMIRSLDSPPEICLYDGSDEKVGSYYAGIYITRISLESLSVARRSVNLIAFKGRFSDCLVNKLTSLGQDAIIEYVDNVFCVNK